MAKVTRQDQIDHYRTGIGESCLVCDDPRMCGEWTDMNGEIRCCTCGTTYQILGCKLREEFLKELGLQPTDVAKRYCNLFSIVPILRDYWKDRQRKVPFGTWLGGSPIPMEEKLSFYRWLAERADVYEPDFPDDFNWAKLREAFAAGVLAG